MVLWQTGIIKIWNLESSRDGMNQVQVLGKIREEKE